MLRKFEELITEIEHDGERFIPIEEIARLALNKVNVPLKIDKKRLSETMVICTFIRDGIQYRFYISSKFELFFSRIYNKKRTDIPIQNCIQIVKNLIKWGFVEP